MDGWMDENKNKDRQAGRQTKVPLLLDFKASGTVCHSVLTAPWAAPSTSPSQVEDLRSRGHKEPLEGFLCRGQVQAPGVLGLLSPWLWEVKELDFRGQGMFQPEAERWGMTSRVDLWPPQACHSTHVPAYTYICTHRDIHKHTNTHTQNTKQYHWRP